MNFFIVPPVLYQAQQKMKPVKKKKSGRRSSSKSSLKSDKTDAQSVRSSTAPESLRSFPESPHEEDEHEGSDLQSERLKQHTPGTGSGASSISARHSNFESVEVSTPPSPTVRSTEADYFRQGSVYSGSIAAGASGRRNSTSSIAASFVSHQRNMTSQGRKMSYSQVPSASTFQPPPGTIEIRPDLFKSNYGTSSDTSLTTHATKFELPKYHPLTDLSILNSQDSIEGYFINPSFQVFRFNNYLDLLSDHHLSDPINFATIRDHSLMKFMSRHKASRIERTSHKGIHLKNDIRYYEGILSYELVKCRSFLRTLIRLQSSEDSLRSTIISCEELLQGNFINYIRFLIDLPNVLPIAPEQLDEILAQHYKFKLFFAEMSNALYTFKKDEYGGDVSSSASDVELLIHSIMKVSYEFILLEKYHIHILVKLNHNSLIENRITKHLFNLYGLNMRLNNVESLKVLNYNTIFSAQYSWYLAITIPFVRVFESNVFNENRTLVNDRKAYEEHFKDSDLKKDTFRDLDIELYHTYFKHLNLSDYEAYSRLSRKDLVLLHKSIEYKSDKHRGGGVHDPSAAYSHKPRNFEYYSKSLATIASETFHVIQARDLTLQLTPSNHKVVLSEFFRILKKGGILEMPLFKSGDELLQTAPNATRHNFPNALKFMNLNVAAQFNMIPHFLETLFTELQLLFGAKNVKFGSVLLTSKNEVNSYLFKHIGLTIYEVFGEVDKFCARYGNEDGSTHVEEPFHYYFYIRAEKV